MTTTGAQPSKPQLPDELMQVSKEDIDNLKQRLIIARDRHKVPIDSIMFNGSTVAVLVFTATSAFIPSINQAPDWIAPLLAGLSGVLVAMERALGFGARWRFHREMYFAYESIIDMLDFCAVIPTSEQSKYMRDLFTALYSVRSRESAIPNVGENPAPT